MVGWMMPRLIVSKVAIASTAPAAPSRCPIIDLVLLIATLRACSPRAIFSAFVSPASLSCVDVPWALTYSTSAGSSPASLIASVTARAGASPVVLHRHRRAGHVGDDRRRVRRVEPALGGKGDRARGHIVEGADPGSHRDADPEVVLFRQVEARVDQSHARCRDGQLREPRH